MLGVWVRRKKRMLCLVSASGPSFSPQLCIQSVWRNTGLVNGIKSRSSPAVQFAYIKVIVSQSHPKYLD
ncbi:hypothetical protein Y1Q_0016586 [Alligator mississippiensis]|uniref:Uncharacterized protein n=1 Tax=Alligator mississippiensis TaxID=8496 RepID=A0A151MK45_ALLMI|nr:hypothetical protein Y1Q_0016586 [Alligator mississippiensis]